MKFSPLSRFAGTILPGALFLLISTPLSAKSLEEVTVVSMRDATGSFSALKSVDEISPGDHPGSSMTAELLELVPGVSMNGQGGSLQAYSIRGMSRARVQTRLNGIVLNTERRAGNAASFIDPFLLDRIEVVKGPSSVLYGNGAIGGVVSLATRDFTGTEIVTSMYTNGPRKMLGVGGGAGNVSFGLAFRDHEDGRDPRGDRLNDGLERASYSVRGEWQVRGDVQFEVSLAGGHGKDIGKSSAEFPESRVTDYPEEDHLLANVTLRGTGWSLVYGAHDYALDTLVDRCTRTEAISAQGFDQSVEFQKTWKVDHGAYRLGAEWLGRTGVKIDERIDDGNVVAENRVLDGRQQEWSLFGDRQWHWNNSSLHLGVRYSDVNQKAWKDSSSDSRWTTTLGVSHLFSGSIEGYAQVSTGYRYPQLAEKFYNGVTPRGEVRGNASLEAEQSLSAEIGIHLDERQWEMGLSIYYADISDYIERQRISDQLLTYRNIGDGRVHGIEIWYRRQLSGSWHLAGSGHWMTSEDDRGEPLQDMTPAAVRAGLYWQGAGREFSIDYRHRFDRHRVHPSELALDRYDRVSVRIQWTRPSGLKVAIWAENLLNDSFMVTSDDLSPRSSGAGAGISMKWYN